MGELSRSFKPETMRLFVKLDGDGKYHEVENISSFGIKEDGDWFTSSRGTITLEGIDLHTSNDAFRVEKEHIKPTKVGTCKMRYEKTFAEAFNELYDLARMDCSFEIADKAPSKRDLYRYHLPKRVIVNGQAVVCYWPDGSKTYSCCHDGDEMDVRTGILLNAIKKWMPGGTYWQDVMEDVTVEDQNEKRSGTSFKRPDGLEAVGHAAIEHHPCRPYMRGGKYGDDEKVMVIEAVEGGMSQADASRKFGISQGTVSKWMAEWRGKNGND